MTDDLMLQAQYCKASSPLYSALFETLAGFYKARKAGRSDPALRGFFEAVDRCWRGRTFNNWFERPLLLAGALHEQTLQGHAPALSYYYASCGGNFSPSQTPAFAEAVKTVLIERHRQMVLFWAQTTIQTNETSRGLSWLLPLLAHWQKDRPAISLIEFGCSAALGLVADQYGYQVGLQGGAQWQQDGAPLFNLSLTGKGAPNALASLADMQAMRAAITRRVGCDLNPLDCRDEHQKRILEALIWPDNVPRLERLRTAIKTQNNSALSLETGDMVDCVQRLSRQSFDDMPMICIFNTIASCYLDDAHYARLRETITTAFHDPWANKDCLWIEFEMPRMGEELPDFAKDKETLIKMHRRGEAGDLQTRYFGAAKAHIAQIEIF
jgi:hypothetical protein